MKAYFETVYDLEDCPEDYRENWTEGDACVAKMDDSWYRSARKPLFCI